jgi:hypothetical protein
MLVVCSVGHVYGDTKRANGNIDTSIGQQFNKPLETRFFLIALSTVHETPRYKPQYSTQYTNVTIYILIYFRELE